MTSKKTAASKRANLPRASDYTKEFLKDWQRLSQSGRTVDDLINDIEKNSR